MVEGGYDFARAAAADGVVATRMGQPIRHSRFRGDVAALAARLPERAHVLNGCTDRYRFMVGLAAALARRQITLLPPGETPGVRAAIAAEFSDLYALTDTVRLPIQSFAYPDDLDASAAAETTFVPANQTALILFTSGSTGKPKPVAKSWGPLVRSARAAGSRLGLAGLVGATVIATVPHQHSYGLESAILLALQHGLIVDTACPLYPADIRAAIARAARPRILVTAPVHLRALLAEPEDMPRVELILSATAPLPKALAAQAERHFGARLIEIYGCTEAGQIATRRTAQEAAWHCLDGVGLTQDADGTSASGAAVAGSARLHDVIELTGPATFRLGDRAADLVDVAGKRTSLAYLNHQLLSISGVRDGAFVMRETDGARVARLMAVAVAPAMRSEAILHALRGKIDAAFLPRPLLVVDELPRNALGKLPREALLRMASGLASGQGA